MMIELRTANDVEEVRRFRDWLLVSSDWSMMPDAPTDKTAWAQYRQQLRDFPSIWTPGSFADFPEAPNT